MAKPLKIGLLGIFEDYSHRCVGPYYLTSRNIECGHIKHSVGNAMDDTGATSIVHDPFYIYPAAATFGVGKLDVNLAYLYTQLSQELLRKDAAKLLITHSILDIYAEIILNHGRKKWLEAVVKHHLPSYSLLIHVPLDLQNNQSPLAVKYDNIVRRLIHDFRANYYRLCKGEDVNGVIKKHFDENSSPIDKVDGIQAVSSSTNTEVSS
jgi:hypothetical protein